MTLSVFKGTFNQWSRKLMKSLHCTQVCILMEKTQPRLIFLPWQLTQVKGKREINWKAIRKPKHLVLIRSQFAQQDKICGGIHTFYLLLSLRRNIYQECWQTLKSLWFIREKYFLFENQLFLVNFLLMYKEIIWGDIYNDKKL